MLVSIEGLSKTGKTTLCNSIIAAAQERDRRVVRIHEDAYPPPSVHRVDLDWWYARRALEFAQRHVYESDVVWLADRYIDTLVAYADPRSRDGRNGVPPWLPVVLKAFKPPDLTILLRRYLHGARGPGTSAERYLERRIRDSIASRRGTVIEAAEKPSVEVVESLIGVVLG